MARLRTLLWISFFLAVLEMCCCLSGSQTRTPFSSSLRLTRGLRSRVQKLLLRYKDELLGDPAYNNRKLVLNTLPRSTINYQTWLQMQATERLQLAFRDLNKFWMHLERQRQMLEDSKTALSVSQSMQAIQLDLRDLMRQINLQLVGMTVSKQDNTLDHTSPSSTTRSSTVPQPNQSSKESPKPIITSLTVSTNGSTSSIMSIIRTSAQAADPSKSGGNTQVNLSDLARQQGTSPVSSKWVSLVEGYVILRDLERYLNKLVRDYTLLQSQFKLKRSEVGTH